MNLESVKRQSFGARYERTSKDKILTRNICEGRLIMSPHPEWQLPHEPTWLENPLKDGNWQFQYHSLRWLDPLRREAVAGDKQALRVWEHYVRSWIRANPAGKSKTKWAWIDMGDALRTYVLAFGLGMYDAPPAWLVDSLAEHALWIANEENLGHGNHALHQHQALFVAASILEKADLVDLAITRMGKLAVGSYDAQGVNEEGSISYQEANYHWWNEALRRLELEGIEKPSWGAILDAAPESLAHSTQPDGNYVRIGDMDSGSPARINSPFTEYVSSRGASGTAPKDLIKIYERGYIFGRSGWGETERDFSQETFFSLCFGSQRKIHGHADGGSLTYFASGYPWLIDTGKYLYGKHPMRSYVVNRPGHNLLLAMGRTYDRSVDVTLLRKAESSRHFEAVTRDTGYEGVLISRRTIFSKRGEYVLVLDAVSADDEVEIEQRWHAHESSTVELRKTSALLNNGNAQCELHWVGRNGTLNVVSGETQPYNGWTSTGWRKNKETSVVSARQKGTQLTFRTVIGGQSSTDGTTSTMRRLSTGYLEFTVQGRAGKEYILVGKKGVVISDHPFSSDNLEKFFVQNSFKTAELRLDAETAFGSLVPGTSTLEDREAAIAKADREFERIGNDKAYRTGLTTTMIDIAGNDIELPSSLDDALKSRVPLITWDENRPVAIRGATVRSYASRRSAAQDTQYRGIQTYRYGSLTLPVATIPGEGECLHASFHGALDRGKYSLPRFERSQSLSSLCTSQVVFADPTLDLDPALTLAWFLGTRTQDLHQEIALFITNRMSSLGLERLVLSGSSGGGFAALQVAAFIPGCTVVAFNPQTSVTSYHPRLAEKATEAIFTEQDLTSNKTLQRLNVAERYRALNSKVNILFVNNDGDIHHSKSHRDPFLAAVSDLPNITSNTITESWGPGHRSPSAEVYLRHLSFAGLHTLKTSKI